MSPSRQDLLRRLPKMDDLLRGPIGQELLRLGPRWAVLAVLREHVAGLRRGVLQEGGPSVDLEAPPPLATLAVALQRLARPSLRPVINATGVVLHTNLGRAPLAPAALAALSAVAGGYSNLELQLDSGLRGSRHDHVAALLPPLTGAEAHLVVNNNAASVVLALAALCAGREVILSRGELIEIGGSFRIPDVMRAAGARLREVGTTNRTHRSDYEAAIGPDTAALMKVHRSNFTQVGFTKEVPLPELVTLARARGVLALCDLGSGALWDPQRLNAELPTEPTVAAAVTAGCDVVMFSCDKLLGGPQAGVLAGPAAIIGRLKRHPLLRALRPDKLTLAALSATLALYRDAAQAGAETLPAVPVLHMLAATSAQLAPRAQRLLVLVSEGGLPGGVSASLRAVTSAVGGGALPQAAPRSLAVALQTSGGLPRLQAALRHGDPAVLARVAGGQLLLDVRTVADAEVPALAAALRRALLAVSADPRDGAAAGLPAGRVHPDGGAADGSAADGSAADGDEEDAAPAAAVGG